MITRRKEPDGSPVPRRWRAQQGTPREMERVGCTTSATTGVESTGFAPDFPGHCTCTDQQEERTEKLVCECRWKSQEEDAQGKRDSRPSGQPTISPDGNRKQDGTDHHRQGLDRYDHPAERAGEECLDNREHRLIALLVVLRDHGRVDREERC